MLNQGLVWVLALSGLFWAEATTANISGTVADQAGARLSRVEIVVTCIDNGMPVVVMRARDLDRTGYETRDALDGDGALKQRLEAIRLKAGVLMKLGDVASKTVPKMTLVAAPRAGGAISTTSP